MKNLKSSRPRDRLSELPESLIFHIFWLLPMRDVVRTTILSKKWKNLWTTTPFLNFSFYEDMNMDIRQVRHFITRAVILWEGIRVQKFKIDFKPGSWIFTDYDFWVHFALRKKVQELSLRGPSHPHGYSVPQNVYSCSSLKELSLVDCCLEINGNVQWNQLKSLRIDGASLSEHVINQILCGSPLLEVFILTHKECSENLSIRSSSLKRLSINREEIFGEPCLDRELRIWTPNLETLEIYGVPYCKCLLMDVSSLTHVTLGFNIDSHGRDFLGETLRQIFPTIQHVESLTLSVSCIKVLVDLKKKSLLPSSSNVKLLKLDNILVGCEELVGVVEIFPKLKMLALDGGVRLLHHDEESLEKFDAEVDANLPHSFLLHLRTVEITWRHATLIFPFIKIVLKYASNLQKMVIRVALPQSSSSLFSASQILLRMPRSSPSAEFIFYKC